MAGELDARSTARTTTGAAGQGSDVGSYLNAGTTFKGTLKSSRGIGIDGKVEGDIESSADVIIGPESEVRADVSAETVVVSGKVTGNITCSTLAIQAGAEVVGNLRPGQLMVAAGATFRGRCLMGAADDGEEVPLPAQAAAGQDLPRD